MVRSIRKSTICFLCLFIDLPLVFSQERVNDLKLHYDCPAEYFEETLVIGNGTIGASVYSGIKQDKISLNDITLWTGEPDSEITTPDAHKAIPEIRRLLDKDDFRGADKAMLKVQGHFSENYQPLGTLTIEYLDDTDDVSDYQRYLNLNNATAHVQYLKQGKMFVTDYFASAPDSVIVVRLKSDDDSGIHAFLSFDSPLPHATKAAGNEISAEGYTAYHSYPNYCDCGTEDKHMYDPERGIHFRTLIRVMASDGLIRSFPSGNIKIDGSKEVLVLITNATSFNGFDKDPVKEGSDYRNIVVRRMNSAVNKTYDKLRD